MESGSVLCMPSADPHDNVLLRLIFAPEVNTFPIYDSLFTCLLYEVGVMLSNNLNAMIACMPHYWVGTLEYNRFLIFCLMAKWTSFSVLPI